MKNFGLLLLCCLQFSCSSQVVEKFNGVSFVASREEVSQESVAPILAVNANSAAVMPFGFIRDITSPEIIFDTDRQWFGETRAGAKQYIEILHKNNIKVLLKPHIWISRGEFTGHMKMETEAAWLKLEDAFRKFIINYAELAQEANVAVFCIGTELEEFVKNRPLFWNDLIAEIRTIYKGKLTYAANWDEYDRVPFWKSVDFIGIDAYFPLSEVKHPTIEELKTGWQTHKEKIQRLSKSENKPVLFTEYGYRSMDYTAHKPWLVDRNQGNVNLEAQATATKAILEMFWKEKWFAGGYVWKWFIRHERAGGANDNRFTPQNKPAEQVLKEYYGTE